MAEKSQMERARAARAIVDSARTEKEAEKLALRGFMAIFHPEYDDEKLMELERRKS